MKPLPNPTPATRRQALPRTLAVAAVAAAAAAFLVACQPAVPEALAAPATAEPPGVPVARVMRSDIERGPVQVARVEAAERVEIRPRVAGPIEAVLFREGDVVRAGQPLFQIDPRPFDAALSRARAELQLARAREALAASEAERARQLQEEQAIAAEERERRDAAQAEAQARRAAAEAALQTAQLEREFTLVRAPIGGRVGRALVTAGNVVAAGPGAPALATLVSTAPLHVHFDVSDRAVLHRLGTPGAARGWKARILDGDGPREMLQAPIDFADHSIDAATGTLRLRARVDAPQPSLIPGQYVRVQLVTGQTQPALMVPDKAVGTDQGQRYVLVVGADGVVEYRAVTVGEAHADHRLVTGGLREGELVIVSGLMRVRPGMTVRAQHGADPSQAQASAPARS
ncbi:efflux RND transporter periplasmic adaptor subunit [uncultured Piscinibacter sp.]|uniref:efflux RND transporter periplasmic adaptor subunit n=1 Tax=uncultured Piscinibacter sp. TaxID=1131835 RepID=UPI0026254211|nr:efflux RND transporter periplasmic adaptor subunit [uncultured Piscinibacter sp.]